MRLDQKKTRMTEERLPEQLGEFDQAELKEFFRQYRPLVRKLWQRFYVPDLELDDWEQEARLVMVRVLKAYQGGGQKQFAGFLKQSLVNRILDLYRARQADKRIPAKMLSALTSDFAELLCDQRGTSPAEVAFCQQCLRQLVVECSDLEREVLWAIHSGYTVDETAEKLGRSKRAVQSAVGRARTKLVKIINR